MHGGWNEKWKSDTLNTELHDEMKLKSPEDRDGYTYLEIIQGEKNQECMNYRKSNKIFSQVKTKY